jgi:preprotein translocase subunit YajC
VNYLPLIIFLAVVVLLLFFAGRARRRQAVAAAQFVADIEVGSEVMTTSGLYGVVVVLNEDDSVQMSIAPGVEVKWAIAALRAVSDLPPAYRGTPGDAAGSFGPDRRSDAGVRLDKSTDRSPDTEADRRPGFDGTGPGT